MMIRLRQRQSLDPVAGNPVTRSCLAPIRDYLTAFFDRDRATSVEDAALRRPERAGDVAGQDYALPLALEDRVGDGDSRKQGLRIGMKRVLVDLIAVGQLHELAEVHHGNAVAN